MYTNNTAVIGASRKMHLENHVLLIVDWLVRQVKIVYTEIFIKTFNIDIEKKIVIIILYFIQCMTSLILICITRHSKSEGGQWKL